MAASRQNRRPLRTTRQPSTSPLQGTNSSQRHTYTFQRTSTGIIGCRSTATEAASTPTPSESSDEHGPASSGDAGKTTPPTNPPNTKPSTKSSPPRVDTGRLMREAVVLHQRVDNVLGYLQVRLGTTLRATRQRRDWDAVDESFAAAAPLVSRHPLSRVMPYAAWIPHLIEAHHDYAQAAVLFNRAVRDCRRFGLTDTLLGLARLSARYGL